MEPERRPWTPAALLTRLATLLLLAGLVVGTVIAGTHAGKSEAGSPAPATFGPALRLSTQETAALWCPAGAAFSHDGARLAVFGPAAGCDTQGALVRRDQPHVLAVYDTHAGVIERLIPLDTLVASSLASRSPDHARTVRAVRYVGLGWTPDDTRFAALFAAFDTPGPATQDALVASGMVLVNIATGMDTLIHGDGGFFDAPLGSYTGLPIYDIAGAAVSAPFVSPAGLAFAWSERNQPEAILPLDGQPLRQLPISAGPRYPVGQPGGGATFTLWQPGFVLGPRASAAFAGIHGTTGAFVTTFPTWSPSGTYATLMVAGVALPSPPNMPPAPSATPGAGPLVLAPDRLTLVPARDAALQAVQREIGANGWAQVAWNPDGSLLASIACVANGHETLTLRDTQTGAIVSAEPLRLTAGDLGCESFTAGEDIGDYAQPNLTLLWSPDGGRVLVSDQHAGQLTLWSVMSAHAASTTAP
jgi:hypothetical protein